MKQIEQLPEEEAYEFIIDGVEIGLTAICNGALTIVPVQSDRIASINSRMRGEYLEPGKREILIGFGSGMPGMAELPKTGNIDEIIDRFAQRLQSRGITVNHSDLIALPYNEDNPNDSVRKFGTIAEVLYEMEIESLLGSSHTSQEQARQHPAAAIIARLANEDLLPTEWTIIQVKKFEAMLAKIIEETKGHLHDERHLPYIDRIAYEKKINEDLPPRIEAVFKALGITDGNAPGTMGETVILVQNVVGGKVI